MSTSTGIEWTDATWNPVVGCERVSPGCAHCYAKQLHDLRHRAFLAGKQVAPQYAVPFETVQLKPERLTAPFSWRAPRRIFVNSVSDLFHDDIPLEYIASVFAVMAATQRHTYQVLTKRPVTAPASVLPATSLICARCDGPMVITYDALQRPRVRCPDCDGTAEPRRLHPDEVRYPVRLDAIGTTVLPLIQPGQLRCQRCACGAVGDRRFCDGCKPPRKAPVSTGPRTYAPKPCAFLGCETVFQPTGPNARFCEAHR